MKRFAVAGVLLVLLANPSDLSSCGPFFPQPVFTPSNGPEGDSLGILQPTYARRYLALAYRQLSGMGLSDAQGASVDRMDDYRNGPSAEDALQSWLGERAKVPGTKPVQIDLYRQTANYNSIPSCLAGAFDSARATLAGYLRDFGPGSRSTLEWLAAQDRVFANCGEGVTIPASSKPDDELRIRQDRVYQIAAANFYAGQYAVARKGFEAIAADKASPWHLLAPYLVARIDLRQSNFADAQQQLEAVLANPAEAPVHGAARSLLAYARNRLDPAGQLLVLARRLMRRDARTLGKDLSDYTFLYDRLEAARREASNAPPTGKSTGGQSLEAVAAKDDLTNWIFTFQQEKSALEAKNIERWKAGNSLPWLITSLRDASGRDAAAASLIGAAWAVPPDSSAYPTARFEGVRLSIERKDIKQAIAAADEALRSKGVASDPSVANAFHAERMKVAQTFGEFLAHAPRVSLETAEGKAELTGALDADGTAVFNTSLPQTLWLEAARNGSFGLPFRREVAQAGWVRAVLLGNGDEDFAAELAKLKASYAAALNGGQKLKDPAEKRFAAVYWILHHPELQPWVRSGFQRGTPDGQIDDFRDNWWNNLASARHEWANDYHIQGTPGGLLSRLYPAGEEPEARFLTAAQKQVAAEEQKRLLSAGGAPAFLSAALVAWVRTHPNDPRNAEALALAVRTSRFGTPDAQSKAPVSQAFHLLHRVYGSTAWARRTPYWY